jgi:uncharacterized damage-inducible protein DinB
MAPTSEELARAVGSEAAHQFREAAGKINHCLSQLSDEQVWWRQAQSQNSIANVLLHLCGNMRQWIISGIGGAPDIRDRPGEFSQRQAIPKAELQQRLDDVVREACGILAGTTPEDLLARQRIQGFDVTALEAILKTVTHFVGHAHQVVYITRCLLGDAYRFQWAPATPEQGAAK